MRPRTRTALTRAVVAGVIAWVAVAAVAASTAGGPPDPARDCGAATTPAARIECAQRDQEAAARAQDALLHRLEEALPPARRPPLTRAQKAWDAWKAAQCAFEASGASDATDRALTRWRCEARVTRERSAMLEAAIACAGAVDCGPPARTRP
jgi:uncharacterized protein YecT (DUF1311 family)